MLIDVLELMLAKTDDVAVTQCVLLDQLAVDVGAVRTTQIFQERVVKDGDDERVLSADGKVINLDIVVGFAADRYPFLA